MLSMRLGVPHNTNHRDPSQTPNIYISGCSLLLSSHLQMWDIHLMFITTFNNAYQFLRMRKLARYDMKHKQTCDVVCKRKF